MLPDAHRRRDLQTVLCREVSPDGGLQKVSCLERNTDRLRVRVTDEFSEGGSALSCAAGTSEQLHNPQQHPTLLKRFKMGGGGKVPYPKHVWSPSGGWYAQPTRGWYAQPPTGRPIPRCHFSLSSELQHSLGRSARKEKSDTRCLKKAGSTPADSALHFPMLIPYISLTNPAAGADK